MVLTSLSVRRNTNLDLCLRSPVTLSGTGTGTGSMNDGSTGSPHQQLTIFYDGRVCYTDVTELQARTIILLASEEMDEKMMNTPRREPVSPSLQSPLSSLSMKRSLQRFLQKRNIRIRATSPY
ncbi:hypothetical protein HHK36_023363 [Tetracentron sinense]|uniref:Protein TIFY n=1 Tax=Tetracentron sinense TaxID=13715 RepID=A0A835D5C0_TETSI|nr:hypothetical protein HHK36_023363 [Tetracentron sinense]